ncbi:MAG TPA: RHS repeat-associated core domain-containing protein [Candidatus Limnocylindrales bacterium]
MARFLVLLVLASTLVVPQAAAQAAPKWRTPQSLDPVKTVEVAGSRPADNLAPQLAAKAPPVAAPVWPVAARAEFDGAGRAWIGGLPVRVTGGAGKIRVETLGRHESASGLAVRLSRVDGQAADTQVSIGYAAVASAFGGDWAGRLYAAILPDCAGCAPVPVSSRNDRAAAEVVAEVTVPAAKSVVLALIAGDSSTGGSFAATSLKPSATWSAGGSTGDFGWSYPLKMPPSLGGPGPEVAFSYSSQSLDGLTSATNNQPSWLGDGFGYEPGFIERRYKACADDGHAGTGDLCWGSDNATLSLAGHGGELIRSATDPDLWLPLDDDGTRVQRLRDPAAGNGDNDGEYWKVTTTDGTQYFFGRHRLTGWQAGRPETNSVSYQPVFGDDAGEPCYQATYSGAWCIQGYRWNLDHVVDTRGNTMSFWYARETNNYSRNLTDAAVSAYVRNSHLTRIDYGTDIRSNVDTTFTGTAPARVLFTVADRCALGTGCETHDLAHWPDVPWDRECTSATACAGRYSPTFWSTKRLSSVTTQVATGSQAYKDVDRWALGVQWITPAGGDQTRVMWLNTVTRIGLNGAAPDVTMPAVVFGPTATIMANRVNSTDGNGAFRRYRLGTIANETGGVMAIGYSAPDCVTGSRMPTAPESNTYRCFPAFWTPPGGTQILDYYHKYVVTGVSMTDHAGGNSPQYTTYAYPNDGAFWHYDEAELTPPGKKTWAQWRGYEQVTVTVGEVAAGAPQLQTVSKFFRGKHGDKLPSGSRSQSYTVNGVSYQDENWLAGTVREETVLNGPGGAVVSSTANEPWTSGPTATRTVDGVSTHAYATGTLRTTTRTTLDGGRPDRLAVVANTFTDGSDGTPRGRPLATDDQGDTATGADDTCTRYSYARNDAANIHALVSEVETIGLRCSATPAQATDVLSATRMFYDGGATPVKGLVTETRELSVWNADPAKRVWVTTSRAGHDAYGRVIETFDTLNRRTATSYLPASGAPVTTIKVTNPKQWTTTTVVDPAWGEAIRVTDTEHDALGQLTAVWQPGWAKSDHPGLPSTAYAYLVRSSGGPSAVTTSTLNPDGTGHVSSYQLFDGFLRPRQTQAPAATGTGRVVTDSYHDSRGLPVASNEPYYTLGSPGTALLSTADNAVPAQNRTAFDGAGRATRTQLVSYAVERWRTTTAYGGDRVDVTPAAGGTATSTITGARGQRTELRQYRGPVPTPSTAGSYDRTLYGYDHAGRPTSVVDHAGISWIWGYDQRGRQISSTDPDKGTTTSAYDAAGQLLSTVDARGATLSYVYDELSRKTQQWHGAVGTGTKLAEWTYDTIALGQPTSSVRFAGGSAYTVAVTGYDAANRPTGRSVTVPAAEPGLAGTYHFAFTYTANGTVATQSLPAAGGLPAETLSWTYTPTGRPFTFAGADSYVTETTYLQTGQATSMTHNTFSAYRSFSYDPVTGRLSHLNAQAASTPDVLMETDYGYDAAGNITKISDLLEQYGPAAGLDDTQCFSHDYLRRLTAAWTPDSNSCTAAPSVAGLGGAAPYWLSWTYDPTGNRTSQTAHKAGGDQVTTYAHPAPGQPRPHSLTSTGGAVSGTYSYDAAGNTTSRPAPSGQQALTWDAEGHLAAVAGGSATSSYLYDAGGARLITRDSGGTTLHLPLGMELHAGAGGGPVTATRVYTHAGTTVATRGTGSGLSWLFNDHQGTSSVAVRESDMTITRRRQTPFGMPRGGSAAWPDRHGFVGGFADTTGPVHLGARELDPATGTFLSVDPVIDVGDPQQLNGYSYANQTPITMSDPDGLRPCDYDDCGIPRPSSPLVGKAVSAAKAAAYKSVSTAKKVTSSVSKVVSTARAVVRFLPSVNTKPPRSGEADYIVIEFTFKVRFPIERRPKTVNIPEDFILEMEKRQQQEQKKCSALPTLGGPVFCGIFQSRNRSTLEQNLANKKRTASYGTPLETREETVTAGFIFTRTGETYVFAGTVQPNRPGGASASIRYGWLDTPQTPTDKQISSFVGGYSGAITLTMPGGAQVSRSISLPSQDMTGTEIGYTSDGPGWSTSFTRSWKIPW